MFETFDPTKKGLRKVLREYEELALQVVWKAGEEGTYSGEVWKIVNDQLLSGDISRAAIIKFLKKYRDLGVLGYKERPDRGGYRMIFYSLKSESEIVSSMIRTILSSFVSDFPDITVKIFRDLSID